MNESLQKLEHQWALELEQWAIPTYTTDKLEESPFTLVPNAFEPDDSRLSTPTMQNALEILKKPGSSLLDVGAAAGGTSLILIPPATHVTAVDQNPQMLEQLLANAKARDISPDKVLTIHSNWPCETEVRATVVINANVLYNVAHPIKFISALYGAAQTRLIIELTSHHPHHNLNEAYLTLHDFKRPEGPTYLNILDIISALGYSFKTEIWERDMGIRLGGDIEHLARRASIPQVRLPEFTEFLEKHPLKRSQVVTITIDK